MTEPCPCGSGLNYATCCGVFHSGERIPTTAEQLMRSRYSAFSRKMPQYLLDTLHPDKRSPNELSELQQAVTKGNWLGLQIISCRQGTAEDETGWVAFRAAYDDQGAPAILEENSRFLKENGRWYYIDGQFAPDKPPGRNDPCWCDSGKKFKKCHG